MKMDSKHEKALETCKDCLQKGYPLSIWFAFGIPDEDRLEIIKMAKKALGLSA